MSDLLLLTPAQPDTCQTILVQSSFIPFLPEQYNTILIGDKGYDSDEYRTVLAAKGIKACIPSRKGRKSSTV